VENRELVGYTVPQYIRKVDLDDGYVQIFFRVRVPMKNKRIVLTANGEELASFPRLNLAPAEMENVKIKKSMLKDVDMIGVSIQEMKK